jgi:hypothetical protein
MDARVERMNSHAVSRRARAALTLSLVLPAGLALNACSPAHVTDISSPTPEGSSLAATYSANPAAASPSAAPSTSATVSPSANAHIELEGWMWANGSPVRATEGAVASTPAPDESKLVDDGTDNWTLWSSVSFTTNGDPLDVLTSPSAGVLQPTTSIVTVINGKVASPFAAGHDPFAGNAKTQAKYPNFTVGDPLPAAMKGMSWPVEVAPAPDGGFVFAAASTPADSGQSGTADGTVTLYSVDKIGGVPHKLGVASDGKLGAYAGHLRVSGDEAGRPTVYWTVGDEPLTTNEWSLPLSGGPAREALKHGVGLGYVKGEPYGLALAIDGRDQITAFGPVQDGKVVPLVRFSQDDTNGMFPSGFTAKGDVVTFVDLGISLNVATKAVTIDSDAYDAARG